jgi:hypothetical protein
MRLSTSFESYGLICLTSAFALAVAGCAKVSVTAGSIQPPNPLYSYNAIEAEPSPPTEVLVRDFDVIPSAVTENRSPLHRAIDLFRRNSADQRRIAIGQGVAATLSSKTVKRLAKTGLNAARVADDQSLPSSANILLVTGRLIDVNEGNRFTRVAFGLGLGESHMATQVRVYRVVNYEKAQVLAFTTYADSGSMPGLAPSIGFGEMFIGPITLINAAKDAVSGGEMIYTSQVDYLAAETGNQISRYLAQYAAAEHWIPPAKAGRVHLAS